VYHRQVKDIALEDYIFVKAHTKAAVFVPHTAGRYQKRRFRKALCPIVERWVQPSQAPSAAITTSSKQQAATLGRSCLQRNNVFNCCNTTLALQLLIQQGSAYFAG
jgi:hypothetical protein